MLHLIKQQIIMTSLVSSIVIIHHEQNIESINNKLNFYCNIARHIALLLAGYTSALFYPWLYYSVFIN